MNSESETTRPGIVVLSAAMHILHMNQQAIDLLTRLNGAGTRAETKQILAAPLHQQCRDVLAAMQKCVESNNWAPVQDFRTIGNPHHAILLKGFGLPDRRGLFHSRIVVVLSSDSPALVRGITSVDSLVGISESREAGSDWPQPLAS
jgi:hypothetical protein